MDPAAVGSVTGVEADVVLAAYYAAEVAAKTIKAGNTNTQVRKLHRVVAVVAAQFCPNYFAIVCARAFVCACC